MQYTNVLNRREFTIEWSADLLSRVRSLVSSPVDSDWFTLTDRCLGPIFAEGNIPSIHRNFEKEHHCNHFCKWFNVPINYDSKEFSCDTNDEWESPMTHANSTPPWLRLILTLWYRYIRIYRFSSIIPLLTSTRSFWYPLLSWHDSWVSQYLLFDRFTFKLS